MKYNRIVSSGLKQLKLNKISAFNFNTKGVENADNSKFDEAVECFNQAINLEPANSLGYFNRATVLMQIGNFISARLDFKLAERLRKSISNYS